MKETDSSAELQLLLRVNEHVQAQREAYNLLTPNEQRRRGPLLLADLLNSVMYFLHQEVEDDREDDDHRSTHGSGRGGGVRRPRPHSSTGAGGRALAVLTSSTGALPFALRDVPALAKVAALEMRLTTMVMSAISTRAIVTLYELEEWACAQEGVEHFVELGLGVGLQVLPVVQEYFQLRANAVVCPVRSRDVISFLLNDVTARQVLLYGGGDTRDLLYRFSAFYERHVLGGTSSSSAVMRKQGRLLNVRQLGVHIQDYPALLASLSQELTSAHRMEHQHCQQWMERCVAAARADPHGTSTMETRTAAATEPDGGAGDGTLLRDVSFEAAARWERNRGLYERVLQSLDSACAHAELVEGMCRTRERFLCTRLGCGADVVQRVTSSGAHAMDFVVTATEAEARSYSLPLSMWRPSPLGDGAATALAGSREGGGGVELRFHVSQLAETEKSRTLHESAHDNNAWQPSRSVSLVSQRPTSVVSSQKQALDQHTYNDVSTEAPPPPSQAVRRRRGTIVSEAPSTVSAGALASTPGAATALETQLVDSQDTPPPLISAAAVAPAPTGTSPASLLASLLAPAGSLGLAAPRSVNTADVPTAVLQQGTVTALESARGVHGGEPVATGSETALERLCNFLIQYRQSSAAMKQPLASASEPSMSSSTQDTWLHRAVAVLETFTVGDVVPVKLLCEAWATCADCRRPVSPSLSPRSVSERSTVPDNFASRRCIPLLHPFAASLGGGSAAPLGRLASLRQQLSAGRPDRASPAACFTAAAGSFAAEETKEIVYMATPAEVCWLSWWGPALSDAHDSRTVAILTCACLDRHYPSSLREIFCDLLGVRAEPTVAAWCTTAVTCARRLLSPEALTPSFIDAYMESFERCVNTDVAARVAEAVEGGELTLSPPGSPSVELPFLQRQQKTAQVALHRLLASVHESLSTTSPWRAEFFPCDHSWRSGLDGLLYATPPWCGYEGAVLTASSTPTLAHASVTQHFSKGNGTNSAGVAPPLRVLCFRAHEPSWAVCAVLHYFGIRPLSQLAETRVSLHTTVATDAGGMLHDKIAAIAPYVQAFCRASFPLWYGVVYVQLRERLRRLRVVLTATTGTSALGAPTSPLQTHRLHFGGHVYAHERHIRLAYVAAHNIIYGAAESAAVPTLAEGLLPLFMPVGMTTETEVQQLRDVIVRLLGALSSLDSSVEWCDGADTSPQQQQWRREQVKHVLQPVALRYGLTAFTSLSDAAPPLSSGVSAPAGIMESGTDDQSCDAEVPFTLPSRASIRYMSIYPPGTDALRRPRGLHQGHSERQPGQVPGTQRLTEESARELVAHAKPFSQRSGADGRIHVTVPLGGSTAVVTSMPAWRSFPMELDLDAVVAQSVVVTALDGGRRGVGAPAVVRDQQEDNGSDDDGDGSHVGVGDSEEEEEEDQESFLTFLYRPGSGTSSAERRGSRGGVGARKRTRAASGDVAGPVKERLRAGAAKCDVHSAGMWLRPSAASAVAGTGGDTPAYAVAAERYVYELLQNEYAKQIQQDGVRVIWVNEKCEAGSPFDILVIKPRRLNSSSNNLRGGGGSSISSSSSSQWDVVQYVEVKSTCTANRQEFEMSMAELLFAARFGTCYCVYRVFGASTDALRRMRHRVYADIVRLWHTAQLTITSDIRVTPAT
ncbi:hypothetical protein JKF63_07165 [Porcisia hertigi]|uniref:Protein NO VEIN C-terminal domain-containing protein n=1 Tax=Porcisia hertigi TaxID=2761500 RepID=A0A836LKN8_9TRYP|nr:hypothetical protein JKF63_07165 [Porcisia hertigi]